MYRLEHTFSLLTSNGLIFFLKKPLFLFSLPFIKKYAPNKKRWHWFEEDYDFFQWYN